MLAEQIIQHCAPTLVGLKAGSIFSCSYSSKEQLEAEVAELNQQLNTCDVWLSIIRYSKSHAFLYVFRHKMLSAYLNETLTSEFLSSYGYSTDSVETSIMEFQRKFAHYKSFPHEMGIFLGFPLEDVRGFIENHGKNYKLVGYWKVYGDAEKAKALFSLYRKCTQICLHHFHEGRQIQQLTIAA